MKTNGHKKILGLKEFVILLSLAGACLSVDPYSPYTKLSNKRCNDDAYRRNAISTVANAKLACSVDSGCQGVYVKGCSGRENDIFLCPTGVEYKNSGSSCIYQKVPECVFVPVPLDECPCTFKNAYSDTQECVLAECLPNMHDNEVCEANKPLPDGNSNYDVNNCPGNLDVFKCVRG